VVLVRRNAHFVIPIDQLDPIDQPDQHDMLDQFDQQETETSMRRGQGQVCAALIGT